jgi:hypothetical protein
MKVLLMKCRPVFGYLLFLRHTDMFIGRIESVYYSSYRPDDGHIRPKHVVKVLTPCYSGN